jgi:hypothetical protein
LRTCGRTQLGTRVDERGGTFSAQRALSSDGLDKQKAGDNVEYDSHDEFYDGFEFYDDYAMTS